jgi:hypothetical protein
VTEKRLEFVELVRRVHIGQQPFTAKHRDVFLVDDVHPQVLKQIQHLKATFHETSDDCRMAGASVDRTQWMISAFGPRHDSIHRFAESEKAFEEAGGHERHIAGENDDGIVARSGKGGVKAAQRPAVRNPIRDATDSSNVLKWATADKQNVVGHLTQFIQLPIENRPSTDLQRAFVDAAEPASLAAGENRSAGHRSAILHSAYA